MIKVFSTVLDVLPPGKLSTTLLSRHRDKMSQQKVHTSTRQNKLMIKASVSVCDGRDYNAPPGNMYTGQHSKPAAVSQPVLQQLNGTAA